MKKRDLGKQKPREKPKTQKNNLEWTYPRFFSQDCFFCFFRFPQFFAQLGLGTPKNLAKNGENRGTPKNFEKNKKTKNNLEWTYPRFFSQDCFFFWFSWTFWTIGAGDTKKPRRTKQKKQSEIDLPQILLTGLFLLFFFVFLNFLRNWGWGHQKTSRKTEKTEGHPKTSRKTKKPKKTGMDLLQILLRGLFFFGVVLDFLNIWKCGNGKKGKKQKTQIPNAPSGTFC